jgi:predicted Zn finger-like uncharacterized protein
MSLITRCPACGTMFKVVPDQLRISEGWVRCGHCAEIFDATASLQDPPVAEAGAAAASPTLPAPPPAPAPAAAPAPAPVAAPAPLAAPVPVAASVAAPVAAAVAAPAPADTLDSIDPPPLYPSFPSEIRDSQIDRPSRFREEDEPDLDDVSFVRHARRKAYWARPLMRALLMVLLLLLAGLLLLQYAAHDRDRLAALQPALRPWLQLLCEPLRCQLGPPRQIDSIVIDSSSFGKLRSDAYRLNFTLKNQAPMQVAMPSVELTLTDTQDQPVVRRILAPRDLGAGAVIPAASEWTGSVAVSVAASASSSRIAGYRLLAFYP